jgi:hypothetical protein
MSIILTRSGVENFVLCDPGRFKPSNMNRQITCFVDTLGKNKAEITAEEMKRINPEVKVEVSRSETEGSRKDNSEGRYCCACRRRFCVEYYGCESGEKEQKTCGDCLSYWNAR